MTIACPLDRSTFQNYVLNGYKGNEDPLGDDLGDSSLENGVDTVGFPEGIYTAIA